MDQKEAIRLLRKAAKWINEEADENGNVPTRRKLCVELGSYWSHEKPVWTISVVDHEMNQSMNLEKGFKGNISAELCDKDTEEANDVIVRMIKKLEEKKVKCNEKKFK